MLPPPPGVDPGRFDSGLDDLVRYVEHGARFTDVTVDDLRRTAPVACRFQLTASRYANFFHHFHSFHDRAWRASADDVASLLARAVAPSFNPPEEDEARAFEALAEKTLQAAARQHAERLETTRVG